MSDPLNHLGSIWYHSEPSDVPYFPNQFLGFDFFCCFLLQTGSSPFYRPLLICSCTEQIQDGTFSLLMKASRDVILHGIGIFLPYGADFRGDIEVMGTFLPSHVKYRPEF